MSSDPFVPCDDGANQGGKRITVVEPASWDKNHVQAETEHLDDAVRYAKNPAVGHISNLAKSLISFQVIMAIYNSGCGGGRIELPQRFDDKLITRLHKHKESTPHRYAIK